MKEILNHYSPGIDTSDALQHLGLEAGRYFVVSTHREENVDSEGNFRDLLNTLELLANRYGFPMIVSTHLRTRKRLEGVGAVGEGKDIRFLKPLGFFDYVRLQKEAFCVLSDSGTITEESSILGFPAVTIRQTHERSEGMDEGALIMRGLKADGALRAVETIRRQIDGGATFRMVGDYDVDNIAAKVVRIILSYTDYVNRRVWLK